jgi:colanic acid/amylovoran biosynthesis protein
MCRLCPSDLYVLSQGEVLVKTGRVLNVGLLWHSLDSDNLGVGALTYAQMHLVEQAAKQVGVQVRFAIIGWAREDGASRDARVTTVCQVNAKRLFGIEPELRATLAQCDLVLDIGEGDSFSDIYGWKRLIYLLGTKYLASRKKKALVLSPQTLGPFRRPLAAWLADRAMARARAVCSRDAMSTAYFKSRNLDVEFHEVIDIAFALPFQQVAKPTGRTRVGINVSGLLWAGGYSGKNQFGLQLDYRATLLALIDFFQSQTAIEVVLVPHVVAAHREAEDDYRAAQALIAQRPGVLLAGPFANPVDAKGYISSCHFFIGGRMHACIGAFSAGVPCVPMAYSRKFTGLFNTLGYTHVADCTKDDQATVVARIATAFAQRERLAEQTAAGNALAHSRLADYQRMIAKLLREVPNG